MLQSQQTISNQTIQKQGELQVVYNPSFGRLFIQRNPVSGVARNALQRALRWMTSRFGRTVTQHIGRHAIMIAGCAEHTVFRNPNRIRRLIERALQDPHNVLLQQGRRVLSGGERVLGNEPLMYAVEREFGQAIGTQGERILRVVIRRSGEIITAYPVRSFTTTSVGAATVFVTLDSSVAQAQEQFAQVQIEAQRRVEAAEPSFWEELLADVLSFGLYGGQLNEGEDTMLWQHRQISRIEQEAFEKVVAAAESEAQMSLSPRDREQIRQIVRSALMVPHLLDQELESSQSGE